MENIKIIEQEILASVEVKIKPETAPKEIETMIKSEIINRKYLKENDWQIHYAIERIMKNIDKTFNNTISYKRSAHNHFVITMLLAIIPMAIVLGILRESGMIHGHGGAMVFFGVWGAMAGLISILKSKIDKYKNDGERKQ